MTRAYRAFGVLFIALSNCFLPVLHALGTATDLLTESPLFHEMVTYNEKRKNFGANIQIFSGMNSSYANLRDVSELAFVYHQGVDKLLKHAFVKLRVDSLHARCHEDFWVSPSQAQLYIDTFPGTAEILSERPNLVRLRISQDIRGTDDCDISFGYVPMRSERLRVALDVGVTVPTGSHKRYLISFGNDRRWGLGGGADVTYRLWGNSKRNFKLRSALEYRYLFRTETDRSWFFGSSVDYLRIKLGPLHFIDYLLSLSFNRGGFTSDASYGLTFFSAEEFDLGEVFPEVVAHNFHVGCGYIFKQLRYPCMVGMGLINQYQESRYGGDGWSKRLYLKFGFSF